MENDQTPRHRISHEMKFPGSARLPVSPLELCDQLLDFLFLIGSPKALGMGKYVP